MPPDNVYILGSLGIEEALEIIKKCEIRPDLFIHENGAYFIKS